MEDLRTFIKNFNSESKLEELYNIIKDNKSNCSIYVKQKIVYINDLQLDLEKDILNIIEYYYCCKCKYNISIRKFQIKFIDENTEELYKLLTEDKIYMCEQCSSNIMRSLNILESLKLYQNEESKDALKLLREKCEKIKL